MRGGSWIGIALLTAVLFGCAVRPSEPAACTAQTATWISAASLARFYNVHINQCVHVRGVLADRLLYDRVETIYEYNNTWEPRIIAVYGTTAEMDAGFAHIRADADIVGIATSCMQLNEDARQADPGTMITGPCHTLLGATIVIRSYTTLTPDPPRLTDNNVPDAYRDLSPQTPGSVPATVQSTAQGWFEAARARDIAKMRTLMDWSESLDDLVAQLVQPDDAPFGFLAGEKSVPAIRYFHYRTHHVGRTSEAEVACVCRTVNCDGRWPVALIDTGPGPAWPYACATIWPNGQVGMAW
ncbi:MAG TPA: hypothetical protein VGF56_12910 [Rhizomicrobium sp.]|jgi:hypothetical protein